jgi:hypothetical protein
MPLTADDLEPSDTALNCIRDGWFVEDCAFTAKLSKTLSSGTGGDSGPSWQELYSSDMAVGQKFCIKVEEVLCHGKSKFQVSVYSVTHARTNTLCHYRFITHYLCFYYMIGYSGVPIQPLWSVLGSRWMHAGY